MNMFRASIEGVEQFETGCEGIYNRGVLDVVCYAETPVKALDGIISTYESHELNLVNQIEIIRAKLDKARTLRSAQHIEVKP